LPINAAFNFRCPPDDPGVVKPKIRLEAVVKLRERDEDRAQRDLAEAQRQARDARDRLTEAEQRARRDERARGTAAHWDLVDHAHARALVEARQAERAAESATEKVGASRTTFLGIHARAEAVRRVVQVRRTELAEEAESAERKRLDELATLMHDR
jgi:flagellar export protein FliJ